MKALVSLRITDVLVYLEFMFLNEYIWLYLNILINLIIIKTYKK